MTSLTEAIQTYGSHAFLVTVSDHGPHVSCIDVSLEGERLLFAVGDTARRNADANANVSVLWPAPADQGYNIIVNGTLSLGKEAGQDAQVAITKSVFHRPGPSKTPGGPCRSDCQPLSLN